MKFLSGPLSMFGAKAEIALHEKGIPFELEMVPFDAQDRYEPKHPDVQADEIFFPEVVRLFGLQDDMAGTAARPACDACARHYEAMEAMLGDRDFVAGGYSFADIALYMAQVFAERKGARMTFHPSSARLARPRGSSGGGAGGGPADDAFPELARSTGAGVPAVAPAGLRPQLTFAGRAARHRWSHCPSAIAAAPRMPASLPVAARSTRVCFRKHGHVKTPGCWGQAAPAALALKEGQEPLGSRAPASWCPCCSRTAFPSPSARRLLAGQRVPIVAMPSNSMGVSRHGLLDVSGRPQPPFPSSPSAKETGL